MDLSGDWDVVSSIDEEEQEKVAEKEIVTSAHEVDGVRGSSVQTVIENEGSAGNESSSDIDIIDESIDDIDRPRESCYVPTSLTISTSTEKTDSFTEPASTPSDTVPITSTDREEKTIQQNTNAGERERSDSSFWSRNIGGHTVREWASLLWEYISSLTGFQISCLFGLTFCLYFCITINQTNYIALQEKGNVVSQMEKLVDELRVDNKHLKEQMISEMKNDKLVSSFEHQIRELKKENSKLNHMLYDVVKVLEKQKDTQEKLLERKEDEYKAPFKKEINKLKEHINMLKFDNEELQKQLVRIRYSSYSQGKPERKDRQDNGKQKEEKHFEKEAKSMKKEKNAGENVEDGFSSEIPIDVQQLKKWNELLDKVAKELGIFEKDILSKQDSDSEQRWNWKEDLKQNFKKQGALVSEVASNYAKFYGKVFNNMYDSASNYINEAQENVQSLFEAFQSEDEKSKDTKQNNKIWNIVNELGEKWSQMKKHVSSLNIKEQFNWLNKYTTKPDSDNVDSTKNTETTKIPQFENVKTQSEDEQLEGEIPSDIEKEEWFFKRANLREDLRKDDDGSTENWYLRKKKSEKVIESL